MSDGQHDHAVLIDAERYRFLRQSEKFCVDEQDDTGQWEPVHYEQLDAAIDAAITKAKEQ